MSTSSSESSQKAPSTAKVSETFEQLKAKFLTILEDRFFGNLKHDWRGSTVQDRPGESLASFHSLSDESGSYLVLDGKKVSLDWFRMAAAARESSAELSISPVLVVPSKISMDNPYAVESPQEMAARCGAEDRFHTHRSRARAGMRDRLLVEEAPFDKETLGTDRKYPSKLATQLDAHYRSEITYRPRIRNFMRVDAIHRLREDSRRQFETFYRKEYLFEKTEAEKTEKRYHKELHGQCEELTQALRKIRQERFSATMRVLDKVKPCYEETAVWEKEFREKKKEMVVLWNKVIRLESIWVRRLKFQNFLYLIMPMQWREMNDWIHVDEDGMLEDYPESIAKRDTINLRELKAQNDIWAVKEFFEEYLAKNKPVHFAFENGLSLLKGVAELDVNSLTLLSRLNLLSWYKIDAENESKEMQLHYEKLIANLRYSIQDLLQKKTSLEARSAKLKVEFGEILQNPMRTCIENERTRQTETLLYVMYKEFLPRDQRESALRFSGTESFMYIFDVVTQLLADFDKIPSDLIEIVEKRVRFLRKRKLQKAKRAADEDHRHELMAVQLKRSMAPPYVKPPRTGKLPRSRLKKKPEKVVVIPPVITRLDKIFALAFGEDAVMTEKERFNLEVDMIFQNYCTVQFDQFLRSIGYEPEVDFVTRVQKRDGPETRFLKRKELIPLVMQRIAQWEKIQEKIKLRLFKPMSIAQ